MTKCINYTRTNRKVGVIDPARNIVHEKIANTAIPEVSIKKSMVIQHVCIQLLIYIANTHLTYKVGPNKHTDILLQSTGTKNLCIPYQQFHGEKSPRV